MSSLFLRCCTENAGGTFCKTTVVGNFIGSKIDKDDGFAVILSSCKGKYILIIGKDILIISFRKFTVLPAQFGELYITVKDRVRILLFNGAVEFFIVRVYGQPWCSCCKARIFRVIPLHGCS